MSGEPADGTGRNSVRRSGHRRNGHRNPGDDDSANRTWVGAVDDVLDSAVGPDESGRE